MNFSFSLVIVLSLVLTCLLGFFLSGIPLIILLARFLLGDCLLLGVLPVFLASGELIRGGPSALSAALGGACVRLASGSGGGVKRVRLYRKTPAHLAKQGVLVVQSRPRVWKRLRDPLGSDSGLPGVKFLRVHQG